MPSLGADMTEGTVVEWLVEPGDEVSKGDIVAVVDTTKSAIDVECFASGVVDRLLVETGTTVPVGTPLALISPAVAENGESARSEPGAPTGGDREGQPTGPLPQASPPLPPETGLSGGTIAATPFVRHLAEEAGLDLASVHGTGPGGRITRADVQEEAAARNAPGTEAGPGHEEDGVRIRATPLARRTAAQVGVDLAAIHGTGQGGAVRVADVRAAAAKENVPAADDRATDLGAAAAGHDEAGGRPEKAAAGQEPATTGHGDTTDRLAAMRRANADLMARSKHEIPHYYLSTTVDLGNAVAWLREKNRELPVQERLVTTAVLLKATALAARHVPQLNGFWTDEGFTHEPAVHLGVAVSLRGGGLVAPAIRDAADLPLLDLMARLREVVARARTGRLRASEATSATITVTNLGDQGVEAVFGVIYPPQVALVGMGRVVERPWAVDGLLGVRPVVTVTLSADHRASDGATGARFLATLDHWAQKPEEM